MAQSIFTSTLANALKETLEEIVDDPGDGYEAKALFTKYMDVKDMDDAYEDDLEVGGPGLASEKPEGTEIATGTIKEGYLTRYIARTFGLKLVISDEALEDNKYPKIIQAARRLKKSMWKTADIDAANVLVRMANSSYVGGDQQPLSSASHTLPHGGTFSNKMAVAFTPSHTAIILARSQVLKYPGHDGIIEGNELERILCPTEQWAIWESVVGSEMTPVSGNFAEINVVKRLKLDVMPIKWWTNTTTNYVFQTDAENGLNFRWRRRPKSASWVENDHTMMKYSITARWARGWSDPRCVLCVEA